MQSRLLWHTIESGDSDAMLEYAKLLRNTDREKCLTLLKMSIKKCNILAMGYYPELYNDIDPNFHILYEELASDSDVDPKVLEYLLKYF